MIKHYDLVELVVDLPQENLTKGMVGTVVDVYQDPPGYEVEFTDDEGRTLGLLGLAPEQVRPLSGSADP
ncbi:MAG TPA: DUF4926 domain-containing protein [Actinopolymorphaceae bacterium]